MKLPIDQIVHQLRAYAHFIFVERQQHVHMRHPTLLVLDREDVCFDLAEYMTENFIQKLFEKLYLHLLERVPTT